MALDFGKLNFSTSFKPTSAFPLDSRSYFESYDAAVAAAATAEATGSSNTVYYYGQTVAVVENSIATLYTIQPDKTLAEVGGKVSINENVFAHDENGDLDLYGFADAVAGAQLLKGADGKLQWVKPDASTIEGLQTIVAELQQNVADINTTIGSKVDGTGLAGDIAALEQATNTLDNKLGAPANEETGDPCTGIYAEIDKKANIVDVYTKTETDTAIAEGIAAADHLQRKTIASVDEIVVDAPDADKFIYMVAKTGEDGDHYEEYMVINGAVEKVGNWAVDLTDYVKTDDLTTALAGKVDAVEGFNLIAETEITRLAAIEDGAQVNKIETVDQTQFAIDENKNLTLLDIAMGKVIGLDNALAGKVDVVEGSRLITDEEGTKLAAIEDSAQVNVIDAVSNEFTIAADGKVLNINAIDIAKITGLSTILDGKVNVEEGKGLSTNDLTDDLLAKITANENTIESITLNDVALDITNKTVNIGIAGADLGVVRTSTAENGVSVSAVTGEMEVNTINVNKLVQTAGDYLILNGGSSVK